MRDHIEGIFKHLAEDDPFNGMTMDEFTSLMQSKEMEIIGTVSNYAAGLRGSQQQAIDACYHVMLGHFVDNFDDAQVFIVADALGMDGDGLVRRDKSLQFIYCVLWNTWCEHVRVGAREMIRLMNSAHIS